MNGKWLAAVLGLAVSASAAEKVIEESDLDKQDEPVRKAMHVVVPSLLLPGIPLYQGIEFIAAKWKVPIDVRWTAKEAGLADDPLVSVSLRNVRGGIALNVVLEAASQGLDEAAPVMAILDGRVVVLSRAERAKIRRTIAYDVAKLFQGVEPAERKRREDVLVDYLRAADPKGFSAPANTIRVDGNRLIVSHNYAGHVGLRGALDWLRCDLRPLPAEERERRDANRKTRGLLDRKLTGAETKGLSVSEAMAALAQASKVEVHPAWSALSESIDEVPEDGLKFDAAGKTLREALVGILAEVCPKAEGDRRPAFVVVNGNIMVAPRGLLKQHKILVAYDISAAAGTPPDIEALKKRIVALAADLDDEEKFGGPKGGSIHVWPDRFVILATLGVHERLEVMFESLKP